MTTFEITVQRGTGDGWPVVVEQSQAGVFLPVRAEGTFRLDTAELLSQATARAYGQVLGRALFRDEVRDAFVRARAESSDELHVLLVIEDPGLRGLRWERLCAPLDGRWGHLALDQRVPLSLYLPSLTDRRFPPIGRRDLRALVVVASPAGLEAYDLAPFDAAAGVAAARAALGEIGSDLLAAVAGAAGPPSLDALCERLTAERYTLLHVVCHGALIADGETVLYLADADGQVAPVAGTRLLERLGHLGGAVGLPHLTFLATCEGASPRAEGALGGLGQRLVRDLGMPAVVAMTEAVTIETAEALAGAFYGRLREHGEVDLALVEACAGLAERRDVTVPALFSRLGGRPLFSDALDRQLGPSDVSFGLGRLEALVGERAPSLRERVAACAAALRGLPGGDPAELDAAARAERERALAEVNALSQEIADLSFNALALGREPPAYDARCPFRGLYPFRPEDREFFFGREALVQRLERRLAEHPFLAVLGASGCGKSSLVLAGLVPALQSRQPDLELAYFTPGDDPLGRLEAALAAVAGRPAVVVADQLEELFTLCHDAERRRAFAARLLAAAAERPVVLTMRADFWGECAEYPALAVAMQAHQELIAPMDAAELRAAMEQQAAAVGLRFEADLSDTILDDVRGEPGAMPLLQHALLELWRRRRGRWLRADEYRALGGVQQAIAQTAEAVYEQLDEADRARLRAIFARLTRLDDEATRTELRRDTRRRVPLEVLAADAASAEATRALVARLASARLLVTGRNPATGCDEAEVAHEALIRHWPRLRAWLDEDGEFLLWRQRLGAELAEWERTRRDEGCLLRGASLAAAERWLAERPADLNAAEREYLAASLALRERERVEREQRQRSIRAGVAVAFVALAGALLVASLLWQLAEQERARAEKRFTQLWALADAVIFELHDAIAVLPGSTEARKRLIERALAQFDDLEREAGDNQALKLKLAGAYQRLGEVQGHPYRPNLGKLDDARASYGRSVAILERLITASPTSLSVQRCRDASSGLTASQLTLASPTSPGVQHLLALGYQGLGDILRESGDPAGAEQCHRWSVEILDRLVRDAPNDPSLKRDLALGHLGLGEALRDAGRATEALVHHRQALPVLEQLAPSDVGVRRSLGIGHLRFGDALRNAPGVASALDSYRRAEGELAPLARAQPIDAVARRYLAVAYTRIGAILEDGGDLAQALEHHRKSLAIREQLALMDRADVRAQRDLAIGHRNVGTALLASDRGDEALEHHRESLRIREQLAEDAAGDDVRRELAMAYGRLCRTGALTGQARELLAACDRGVMLAPQGATRDSRGLARALAGDARGAVEDFRAYQEWAEVRRPDDRYLAERPDWIAALEAGENPFDDATQQRLRAPEPAE